MAGSSGLNSEDGEPNIPQPCAGVEQDVETSYPEVRALSPSPRVSARDLYNPRDDTHFGAWAYSQAPREASHYSSQYQTQTHQFPVSLPPTHAYGAPSAGTFTASYPNILADIPQLSGQFHWTHAQDQDNRAVTLRYPPDHESAGQLDNTVVPSSSLRLSRALGLHSYLGREAPQHALQPLETALEAPETIRGDPSEMSSSNHASITHWDNHVNVSTANNNESSQIIGYMSYTIHGVYPTELPPQDDHGSHYRLRFALMYPCYPCERHGEQQLCDMNWPCHSCRLRNTHCSPRQVTVVAADPYQYSNVQSQPEFEFSVRPRPLQEPRSNPEPANNNPIRYHHGDRTDPNPLGHLPQLQPNVHTANDPPPPLIWVNENLKFSRQPPQTLATAQKQDLNVDRSDSNYRWAFPQVHPIAYTTDNQLSTRPQAHANPRTPDNQQHPTQATLGSPFHTPQHLARPGEPKGKKDTTQVLGIGTGSHRVKPFQEYAVGMGNESLVSRPAPTGKKRKHEVEQVGNRTQDWQPSKRGIRQFGGPQMVLECVELPDMDVTAMEILTFIPQNTLLSWVVTRLHANGYKAVTMAEIINWARGLTDNTMVKKALTTKRITDGATRILGIREWRQRGSVPNENSTTATSWGPCYKDGQWQKTHYMGTANWFANCLPNTRSTDMPLYRLWGGVVPHRWPQGDDAGPLTAVLKYVQANPDHPMARTWNVKDIPTLAMRLGLGDLRVPKPSSGEDPHDVQALWRWEVAVIGDPERRDARWGEKKMAEKEEVEGIEEGEEEGRVEVEEE
ncbi:hypothetical protein NA57DRAFT_70280 [Rhizodiscina lignyota]|uniref:Uncharacterized protein n=1 Tax=Rhizodiscina lignyota TaxID=1504668 RepID=A0A9P4MAJ9_9PEZI|nr:hypothetical protein NA57DRAFT_70280 [Rhizodiscina lignyota]